MGEKSEVVLMNSDELFAMRPSKKVDRWLFRGELREAKVTRRNPNHTGTVTNVAYLLKAWLKTRPVPRGRVHTGNAYFRVRRDPDTNLGVDVALASAEQTATIKKNTSYIDGPPILAVEVLSPYDKQREIDEKIEEYLECGTKLVWIVNPYDETVKVYEPGKEPMLFSRSQELSNPGVLPEFRCLVLELFE